MQIMKIGDSYGGIYLDISTKEKKSKIALYILTMMQEKISPLVDNKKNDFSGFGITQDQMDSINENSYIKNVLYRELDNYNKQNSKALKNKTSYKKMIDKINAILKDKNGEGAWALIISGKIVSISDLEMINICEEPEGINFITLPFAFADFSEGDNED